MSETGEKQNNQHEAPPELSVDEKNWAMFCHLSALSIFIIPILGNIIAPLILWVLKKEVYPFVDDQGKEALNFQISMTIYFIFSFILVFIAIGILLIIILAIIWLFLVIIASINARDGVKYRYPLTIRFVN